MGKLSQQFLQRQEEEKQQRERRSKKATARQKRKVNGGVIAVVVAVLVAVAIATPLVYSALAKDGDPFAGFLPVATIVGGDEEAEVTETDLAEAESLSMQDVTILSAADANLSPAMRAVGIAKDDVRAATASEQGASRCAVAPVYQWPDLSTPAGYMVALLYVDGNQYTVYGYIIGAESWKPITMPYPLVYDRNPANGLFTYNLNATLSTAASFWSQRESYALTEKLETAVSTLEELYGLRRPTNPMMLQSESVSDGGTTTIDNLYVAMRIGFTDYFEEMEKEIVDESSVYGYSVGNWENLPVDEADAATGNCWTADIQVPGSLTIEDATDLDIKLVNDSSCDAPDMSYEVTSADTGIVAVQSEGGKVSLVPQRLGTTSVTVTAYASTGGERQIAGVKVISVTVGEGFAPIAPEESPKETDAGSGNEEKAAPAKDEKTALGRSPAKTAPALTAANPSDAPSEDDASASAKPSVATTPSKSEATRALKPQTVTVSDKTVAMGKTASADAATDGDGILTYATSDAGVATVDSAGVIRAVKPGIAVITVTASQTATCEQGQALMTVTVPKLTPTIAAADKSLALGATGNLDATVTEGASKLTYASTDTTIVTVDGNGTVTAVAPGSAVVILSTAENELYLPAERTVRVTVAKGDATITASDVSVLAGKEVSVSAKVTAGASEPTYRSADAGIATVSEKGVVTGVKAGKTEITIESAENATFNGASATVSVTVEEAQPAIPVTRAEEKTEKKGTTETKGATGATGQVPSVTIKPVAIQPVAAGDEQTKVTYSKASGSDAISVDASTGAISVKPSAKPGLYRIGIRTAFTNRLNRFAGSRMRYYMFWVR